MKILVNYYSFCASILILLLSCGSNTTKGKNAISSEYQTQTNNKVNNKISFNGLISSFKDSKGNLWFSTNKNGVYKFDGIKFYNHSYSDGLISKKIYSIIEDQKGQIWLGTDKGLSLLENGKFKNIPLPFQDTSSLWLDKVYPIINPNASHSMVLGGDENIWIGTGGGGAYRFDGMEFTPFLRNIGWKQEDSLFHNWIPSVEKDNEGNIWFASMKHGGVSRYDGEKFDHFGVQDGLADDMVRTIYSDKSGNIWIGYNGNRKSGLTLYDGKSMTNFYKEDNICTVSILTILEDRNGIIWFGGDRGNLCLYDGEKFTEFKSKKGDTYDSIHIIEEDLSGNIWFGGKHGLWKYDGENVQEMFLK